MPSDAEPCVFIYGPESTVVGTIIHSLAGPEAERRTLSDLATAFRWRLDNKYYTADVHLCHVQRKGLPERPLADRCEAVIICFDSHQTNGLDEVDSIVAFTKEFEPDVCLLVCETCSENTPVSRIRAQEWCVRHGFELVELTPADQVDPDDDFPETTGVQRLAQALHAHTWSNLQMKEHQPAISNKLADALIAERAADAGVTPTATADAGVTPTATADAQTTAGPDTLASDLAGLMGPVAGGGGSRQYGPADDAEDFELLFSQLAELRAAAARVPPGQRHDFAERVAMTFLRSLGGDGEDQDSD